MGSEIWHVCNVSKNLAGLLFSLAKLASSAQVLANDFLRIRWGVKEQFTLKGYIFLSLSVNRLNDK